MLVTERTVSNGELNPANGMRVKYGFLNDTMNLTCEARANPLPIFKWYHNGRKESHKHIINTGNFSVLTVK
jgi:hypothetical protein